MKKLKISKTKKLLIFFIVLTLILWLRLFFLEVIKHENYNTLLISQHYSVSDLKPERGNIYIQDRNGKEIPLTQNINLYELYGDPEVIWNQPKVAELLGKVLYKHFCDRYHMDKVDKQTCVENVERFSGKTLIKEEKQDNSLLTGDLKNTELNTENDLSYITTGIIEKTIEEKLNDMLQKKEITRAYIGFFENPEVIEQLKNAKIDGLIIKNNNYVYIDLDKVSNLDQTISKLFNILNPVKKTVTQRFLISSLNKRPVRYVKIAEYVNPLRIKEVKDLQKEYADEKQRQVPLFHGIGYIKQPFRFYPYNEFLSHVIGYINNGQGVGGIEEFYNEELEGKKGKIIGANTPWIGNVGSSSFQVKDAENGSDIYLTIDYTIQKKLEEILRKYYYNLRADSVSAVIINPFNGKVKALAGYPNFNPNNRKEIYKIKPLTREYEYIVGTGDGLTYVDIPVLYQTGGKLALASTKERRNQKLKKYIYKNILGPRTFLNGIISEAYEPGSIFKVITETIGIDTKDISLYDYYQDRGKLDVGPFTISNVERKCTGYNTFLHALEWSCNVGMAQIVMKVGKDIFYNYLQQLGFGKRTGIQLANEETGRISALDHFSLARFYNNSFGQGLLVTPMQMAVSYAATVNGGYLVKPSIIEEIKRPTGIEKIGKYMVDKVFSTRVSKDIIYALWSTVYEGDLINLAVQNYTLGGKTGTSQIAYKGRYKGGSGRTIGSFVGITTKENLKYVIAVKVVRPRSCEWGLCTAGEIYKDIAKFIIEYEGIKK